MKIVIFGASGKTGKLLTNDCLEAGHQVIAYVRNRSSIEQKHENLRIMVGQLSEIDKLQTIISGADACISTLGGNSLTKTSTEFTQGIDNIIKAMEQEKVSRFVYLSSIGTGESKNLMSPVTRTLIAGIILRVPLADHTRNEAKIVASKLNWTIVRPGGLRDEPATGNFRQGTEIKSIPGNLYIPRADVANFLMSQVEDNQCLRKSVWLCI
jgi:putative NADH-flavin reductase